MLVCVFHVPFAHETAGAACTRHSLLPLLGEKVLKNFGRIAPREREIVSTVIASGAKQSICPRAEMWIASLALATTRIGRSVLDTPHARGMTIPRDIGCLPQ
jgi:hypothetical protein